MADLSWPHAHPFAHLSASRGHAGRAGVSLRVIETFGLTQIMARRGQWNAVAGSAERHFGKAPPSKPQAVQAGATMLVWSGADQFLALTPADGGLDDALRTAFAGSASLSDQSDGRTLLRLSGTRAKDAIAKFCSLDLHERAFPVGTAAATSIDHTGVTVWRAPDDGTPVYFILVFSTFAEFLVATMLDAAAEFGVVTGVETTLSTAR